MALEKTASANTPTRRDARTRGPSSPAAWRLGRGVQKARLGIKSNPGVVQANDNKYRKNLHAGSEKERDSELPRCGCSRTTWRLSLLALRTAAFALVRTHVHERQHRASPVPLGSTRYDSSLLHRLPSEGFGRATVDSLPKLGGGGGAERCRCSSDRALCSGEPHGCDD